MGAIIFVETLVRRMFVHDCLTNGVRRCDGAQPLIAAVHRNAADKKLSRNFGEMI
jgi:hypothetical protein